ncbi:hypothetical protein BDW68DRAFT_153694 [Aspergillus falconensis]
MPSKSSYLSDPRCQCDFVVATTQASINSGLLEFLNEEDQPFQYLCFNQDEQGYPTQQVSLNEVMNKSGGINPFDIPEGTHPGDFRVKALSDANFGVGVMLQMGVPLGHSPSTLPPLVTLNTASNVTFNLFCKQVMVVSIKWGRRGPIWNVFKQPQGPDGKPWSMQMSVDLTIAGLEKDLNTPYFNAHPKVRDQLRKALVNLSGTAFSLKQLLFDLDNAVLQTVPDFNTVTDPDAKNILETYFRDIYIKNAKERGLPLVAVTAVAHPEEKSPLRLTNFERIVNPLKDAHNQPITNPTQQERDLTTLDYLCAVNNDPVPRISGLDWSWMQPGDVNNSSGAIALNRNVLARYIADNLKDSANSSCYTPRVMDDYIAFSNGTPEISFPESGANVVHMESKQSSEGNQRYKDEPLKVYTVVSTKYTMDVSFEGSIVKVVQSSLINLAMSLPTPQGYNRDQNYSINVVNKSLSDTYGLHVDSRGGLQLVKHDEQRTDTSETTPTYHGPDDSHDSIVHLIDFIFKGILSVTFQQLVKSVKELYPGGLHELPISQLQNFVFPGAKVFTYKDPVFSDHQDLVCEITYLDPTTTEVSTPQQAEPVKEQAVADQSLTSNSQPVPPTTSAPETGTVGKLTTSTELMHNYVQGQIASPTGKFEALQSSDGHTLLFAVDSSGVFHVIEENSGSSHTGWQVHDLSSAAVDLLFPGRSSDALVRTFDVGQSVIDGSIGLTIAVSIDGNDHLFISLGNSSNDTSWVASPTWTVVPFDPVNEVPQNITVTGALFAETQTKQQYLVVDIDRPSGNSADPHITRYHIDPARAEGHYWVKHDVTVDIAAGDYQSVVGRVSGKPVDGIYTAGTAGGSPQLVYEPVVNYYGSGPAAPRRLQLPQGAIPSAITTVRNADNSTDLYAVGGSTLYRFPSDEQDEDFVPNAVATSEYLSGTDTLRAMSHDGITTLWGRTTSDRVYYLTCAESELWNPKAWSAPMPILSAVERMSSYVNRTDGGNTIFVSGNGRFQKLMRGTGATGGIWKAQDITLASPPKEKATSFMSYTTSIHVAKPDQDIPAPNVPVNLSATSRTPVYINGLYYALSPTPIQVATDVTGSLTVIEAVDSLHAGALTVSLGSTSITINPMDQTQTKLYSLDTAEKVRGARFPNHIVAGGVLGSPGYTPLVGPSVNEDDVKAVATNMALFQTAYAKAQGAPTSHASNSQQTHSALATTAFHSGWIHTANFNIWGDIWGGIKQLGDDIGDAVEDGVHELGTLAGDVAKGLEKFGEAIGSAAGDVFQWIKNEAKSVGRLVVDTVTGVLHFITKIGGKIYHAVLDTVHAIVSAAEWVWNKVKAGLKMLWNFLQMLFEWDDIRRTKNVIHNISKLWLQDQVDKIPKVRQALDSAIRGVEQRVNEWANVSDWAPKLGDAAKQTTGAASTDQSKSLSSSSKFLADKYKDHAHQLQIVGDSPALDLVESLLNELLSAISNEGEVLGAVFNQVRDLVKEFSSLSIEEILRRVAAIIVDGTLSSLQVAIDALLNVLGQLAQAALSVLDTKIHIPVISDILNAIGVSDFSFLDLFTWIGAVAATIGYKIAVGHAPFPADDSSEQTMSIAQAWDDIEKVKDMPSSALRAVFESCHMFSGIIVYVGNFQNGLEAEETKGSSIMGTVATVIKLVGTAGIGAADFLAPMEPVEAEPFKILSEIVTVANIGCGLVFSSIGQKALKAVNFSKLVVADARGLGAIFDAVLVVNGAVVTAWHFYELSQKPKSERQATAITTEIGKVAKYVSRLAYAIAVNDEEEDSRQVAILVMALANDVYAGLLFTEAGLGGQAIA